MSKKSTITKKFIIEKKESCGFADNRVYAQSSDRDTIIISLQGVEAYNQLIIGDTIELIVIKK